MPFSTNNNTQNKQLLYEQILDELYALFGIHRNYRPVHAKGIVCKGIFNPAVSAITISRASHFLGDSVPITVRFSDFAGIPTIADFDPLASPHGMAIRFHLPGDTDTDIVAHSYDGFPTRTAEEFLGFIRALTANKSGSPELLNNFLATHPQAQRFAAAPKPAPYSFATESYYAVNAFRFSNRDGVTRFGRYRIYPEAGEAHLDPNEASQRSAYYLFDELSQRLVQSAARFRLLVQIASKGDPIDDGSQPLPADRPQIAMGTLSITSLLSDSALVERQLLFDPARLVDGIELSDDSLPAIRSVLYAISFRRRNA